MSEKKQQQESSTPMPVSADQEKAAQNLYRQLASVPGFSAPRPNQAELCPLPANCSQEDINEYRSAGVFLQSLASEVRAWSKSLPETYRPAIVAVLHGGIQIQVRSLSQVSFHGIRIEGKLGGSPCSLLAHQSTIQMLCHAIEIKQEEEETKRPIGFIWSDTVEEI